MESKNEKIYFWKKRFRFCNADKASACEVLFDIAKFIVLCSSISSGTTTLGASGSGLYATHGSTGWSSVSDERYKKDITDATLGLSFINDLRPRTFKWKTCGEVPNDTPKYEEGSTEIIHETMPGVMHGFIAQEVKTVIDNHSNVPDNQLIWKETPDGIQNLAKEELIPALVKAVQELSAKNDALETRIQELEG